MSAKYKKHYFTYARCCQENRKHRGKEEESVLGTLDFPTLKKKRDLVYSSFSCRRNLFLNPAPVHTNVGQQFFSINNVFKVWTLDVLPSHVGQHVLLFPLEVVNVTQHRCGPGLSMGRGARGAYL